MGKYTEKAEGKAGTGDVTTVLLLVSVTADQEGMAHEIVNWVHVLASDLPVPLTLLLTSSLLPPSLQFAESTIR